MERSVRLSLLTDLICDEGQQMTANRKSNAVTIRRERRLLKRTGKIKLIFTMVLLALLGLLVVLLGIYLGLSSSDHHH